MKQSLARKSKQLFAAWGGIPTSSPQRWFVVLAVFFGTIFALLTPPYAPPDEYNHLARAYSIAHGSLTAQRLEHSVGGYPPQSFTELGNTVRQNGFSLGDVPSLGTIPLAPNETRESVFANLVMYSPTLYLPQALGLGVGELLNLPAYYTLVLARICNLAVYILLLYWAIRLLPYGKWAAVIVGLLPMHILLAASVSADPVTTGLMALFVALILWLRDRQVPLSRNNYLLLLGLVALVSLTKLPYPLLLLLLLLLPQKVLGGSSKARWKMLAGCAATATVVGLGWLLWAKTNMVPYGPPGTDPGAQAVLMLTKPWEFITALGNTLITPRSDSFIQTYIISAGPVIAWLPIWVTIFYSIFLTASLARLGSASAAVLQYGHKLILTLVLSLVFVIIWALLYISWTPVGLSFIEGGQARYFTPLILLLIPLLTMRTKKGREREGLLNPAWYRYVPLVLLVASTVAALYYFYELHALSPF